MSTDSTTPSYWLCPLYSFDCDCNSIDLPEGLKILKIPNKFSEYLDKNYPDTLPTILSEAKWAVSIEIAQINTTNMNAIELMSHGLAQYENATYQLVDLITTLRLFKKGRIVAGLLTSAKFQNSEYIITGNTIWPRVSNILFFQEQPIYKLKESELPKVISLFQQIRGWRTRGILDDGKIPLERFHSSYHGDIEDRIIDQMIALESLYLGNEQELTYKLAIRTAFLLRKRQDHRSIVFNNIKEAYRYRSRIVHGSNPPSKDELRPVVSNTGDYLRQSIRKFLSLLSQGNSLREIREKLLDENILKEGNLLA